jgi:hypothetical protein
LRKFIGSAAIVAAFAIGTTAALAAVTFDPATGTGFVGKGDVQLVFGWNNKALQDNAGSVDFRSASTETSETTWTCKRDSGEQTQERLRTTTTTIQGLVTTVGRLKNQITGFNLNGYEGTPTTTTVSDGPALGSCPQFWTEVEGSQETVVTPGTTTLEVSINGTDWFAIG